MARTALMIVVASLAGCSLVIDTSETPRELRLDSPTLYEGLGSWPSSRMVPIGIRGADLQADDEVTLRLDNAEPVVCDDACYSNNDAQRLCCAAHVGEGNGGIAARIPLIYMRGDGQLELLVSVRRRGRLVGQAALSVEALPERTPDEFGEDVNVGASGIVRYSQITIWPDTSLNLEGPTPARLRVTGILRMHQGDGLGTPEDDDLQAGTITATAGSCDSCDQGEPATLYPLRGAGPETSQEPGAGAMAVRVDGAFVAEWKEDPAGDPLFLTYGGVDEQGGAVVVSLLGAVTGGLVLRPSNSENMNGLTGSARLMGHPDTNSSLIAVDQVREPALIVGSVDRPFGELPVVTQEPSQPLEVVAAEPLAYFYVVENGGELETFVPDGGIVPFELRPGLNRVCVLIEPLEELPDEVFEEGQCFNSLLVP